MRGHLPSGLGRVMALLPLPPLELILQRLADNVVAVRPDILARLESYAHGAFAIDPIDCPFVILITVRRSSLSLRVLPTLDHEPYAARIVAPLVVLLGLLEGAYDGDALFFSRDLVIDGDTEAVLSLRNALENAELVPSVILGVPESLAAPVSGAVRLALERLRLLLDAPPAGGRGHPAPFA